MVIKRRHYNIASTPYELPRAPGVPRPPSRRPPPEEWLIAKARGSREGGRARCIKCRTTYGMTPAAMRLVHLSFRNTGYACQWCRKKYDLQLA